MRVPLGGRGDIPPIAAHLLLTHLSDRTIIPCVRSNTNSHHQRRNQKPGEAPRPDTEDSTPWPIPKALAQARGPSQRCCLLTTGPVPLPCPPGDGRSICSTRYSPFLGPLPNRCSLYWDAYVAGIDSSAKFHGPALPGLGPQSPYAAPPPSP